MLKTKKRLTAAIALALAASVTAGGFFFYNTTYITIHGEVYRRDVAELDLAGTQNVPMDDLVQMTDLKQLDLRGTGLTFSDYQTLQTALPQCRILWDPCFQGRSYPSDTRRLTVTELSDEDVAVLEHFSDLESVSAGDCEDYDQLLALMKMHPDCRVYFSVDVGGQSYLSNTATVTAADLTAAEVSTLMDYLPRLQSVTLTGQLPEMPELSSLQKKYPAIDLGWTVTFGGTEVPSDATQLNLAGTPLTKEEVSRAVSYLPELTRLDLSGCGISDADMADLRQTCENIHFIWAVTIGTKTFSSDAEEIDLSWMPLTVEQVESALPYFPNLTKVDMSFCGISNDDMDALNRRHEDIKIVWTVYIKNAAIRTDITYFMPFKLSLTVNDKDIYNLRYCTDVLCVDLGHMEVYNCEFAAYMPHLKYLLLGDTRVSDLSPLKGLKELIYLEVFMTWVRDYTPLLECPALEDLNICWTYGDPAPIAKMTWLKNLWWGGEYILSDEEDQKLRDALPNTYLELAAISSTGRGWRNLKNYFDMRDLLGMWYMEG